MKAPSAYYGSTPPKISVLPDCPALAVKKKAKELSSRTPEFQRSIKTGVTLSTEIEGQAIPKIPSNLATVKESPYNLVTSPNYELLAVSPPRLTFSIDQNPSTAPDP